MFRSKQFHQIQRLNMFRLRTLAMATVNRTSTCYLTEALKAHSFSCRFNSSASIQREEPQLMIAFTCKKCDMRTSHKFSKQAYTTGLVLIQCPGCKNRHLIADNLNIFRDNKVNLEDLMKAQGELVATTTDDLVFEDIPELLRGVLGVYAKDAPDEYHKSQNDHFQKSIEGEERK